MSRKERPTYTRTSPNGSSTGSDRVLKLLAQGLAKYHVSNVAKPRLSREAVVVTAARELPRDEVRKYLDHVFKGANAQLAEEARSELVPTEEQSGWTAEKAAESNKRFRQRAPYEIVRKPERVEEQTAIERVFVWIVFGCALMSLFVAWNMVSVNLLNSGQFPALMEFPQSLSLYLMSFAAVVLSFLPKIHFDELNDENERKAFERAAVIVTAIIGMVWALCASLISSPTADVGMTSVDVAMDGAAGPELVGTLFVFSQLAVEVGMGALLWIFGLRLTEKGRLEVAHDSPAYATLSANGDVLFVKRNALEEYRGALRGFLTAMEEIGEAFIEEELARIEAERFRQDSLKRLAIVKELESHADDTD